MSRGAVRLVATLALLAAVLFLVAPQDILRALGTFQPVWFGVAVTALLGQIILSALRWRITAQALGLEFDRLWSMREYGLSVASNTFLPGGVMGDLARVARARHHGWRTATASVVIERFAGQIALGIVALAGLTLWQGVWTALIVTISVALLLVTIARLAPGPWQLLRQTWGVRGVWQRQLGLTVIILALNLLGFYAAVRATGLALSAQAALALIPLTLLSMLLPITINGWGVREAVAAALWPLWGIDPAQAVAATVVFGLACMAAALLGLWPWLIPAQRAAAARHDDKAATISARLSRQDRS